jgi:CHAT domain-containing protein
MTNVSSLTLSGALLLASGTSGTVSSRDVRPIALTLTAGDAVHCRVDQHETDLTITLIDPAGPRTLFDARDRAHELVSTVAASSGTFRLEVHAAGTGTAPWAAEVQCELPHPATADDRDRLDAEIRATALRQLAKKTDRASLERIVSEAGTLRMVWHQLGQPEMELSSISTLATALYRSNAYADAEAMFRDALVMATGLDDRHAQAEILTNLAAALRPRGQVADALEALDRALPLWREVSSVYGEAAALSNRGILLREIGDFDGARRHYADALRIFRTLKDRRGEGYAANNLAIVLETLGDSRGALAELNRVVPLMRLVGDTRAEARAEVSRGRILLALGDPAAAHTAATRGLTLYRAAADRLGEADGALQLGRIAAARKQLDAARQRFSEALAIYTDVGSRRGASDALHETALTHLAGAPAQALAQLQKALELRRALGLPTLEAESLYRLAQASRLVGDLPGASVYAESAIAIVETLHGRVSLEAQRRGYLGAIERYYREAIDILAARHQAEPEGGFAARALGVWERAKARELVDALRRSDAPRAVVDAQLADREKRLRQEVNHWSWTLIQMADAVAGPAEHAAKNSLARALDAHATVEAEIRLADPRYSALTSPHAFSLTDFRHECVADDTIVLEYALGETRSYVWAITSDSLALETLPGRIAIEADARAFETLARSGQEGPLSASVSQRLDRAGRRATANLLTPVAPHLRRHIIVVPDGALHAMPFAALPLPAGMPLSERYELVTAPSATTLQLLQLETRQAPAPKLVVAIGDPVLDRLDSRLRELGIASPVSRPTVSSFKRLPGTRREVEQIVAMSQPGQGLALLDFDASRATLESTRLRDYRYIHIASHAVRSDESAFNGIALSMVNRFGEPQDGFLRLHDIYRLQLRAELVVLSACETAAGPDSAGEGLVSLARAFFYAGVPRVLSSLWPVDDEPTVVLMTAFYRALLSDRHPSPAAALRQAQLEVSHQPRWQHPMHWSGWVLQGAS